MHGIRWASLLEDNPLTLMDRIRAGANTYLLQSMLNSIAFRVFEYATREDLLRDANGAEIGSSAAIDKTTSVFDTLQKDSYWTDDDGNPIDAIGYNFRVTIPAIRFPNASRWYRVEITFAPTSGDSFKIVWATSTTAVASS